MRFSLFRREEAYARIYDYRISVIAEGSRRGRQK